MGKSDWNEGEGGAKEIRQHSFHGDKPGVGDECDEIKQRGQYVAIVGSVNPFLADTPALFVFNPCTVCAGRLSTDADKAGLHLEVTDQHLQLIAQPGKFDAGRSGFFAGGSSLLGHVAHINDAAADLFGH